jgi:hypothetical protein
LADRCAKTGVRHVATGALKSSHYSDEFFEVKVFPDNDRITNFYLMNETQSQPKMESGGV